MSESPVKNKVFIDARKSIQHAFTDLTVSMHLPTDNIGNIVCIDKATRLECWVSKPDQRRKHLPDIMATSKAGISHALLRKEGDGGYSRLPMSVAFASIKVLDDWLYTLHRHPEGDVYAFEVIKG